MVRQIALKCFHFHMGHPSALSLCKGIVSLMCAEVISCAQLWPDLIFCSIDKSLDRKFDKWVQHLITRQPMSWMNLCANLGDWKFLS